MPAAIRPGQRWSMDFITDKLADGRGFRILTVVDQFSRACVLLEAERSMSGAKVAEALQRVIAGEGAAPESITCDNGSEFAGRVLEAWAIEDGCTVGLHPSWPAGGKWVHRSFNGRLRNEFLNVEWLASLAEARRKPAAWRYHYNHQRPHSALADRTPAAVAALHRTAGRRFALPFGNRALGVPRQEFASPTDVALDPGPRAPEKPSYESEALLRTAGETEESLLVE